MSVEISHKLQETGNCGGDDRVIELRLGPYNEQRLPYTRIGSQSGTIEGREAESYGDDDSIELPSAADLKFKGSGNGIDIRKAASKTGHDHGLS